MPNWNSNIVTFTNTDPAQIAKIKSVIEAEQSIMERFVPIGEYEYAQAIETWGTKWSEIDGVVLEESENSIKVAFETAWCPPIAFYTAMEQLGFGVQAYYWEPGMAFCGVYENGVDREESIDYMSPEWIEENISEDIIAEFDLISYATEYAEEYDDAA